MHNLRNVGFLTLTNIEGFDEGEHYKAVKAFFEDTSAEDRRHLVWHNHNPDNKNIYRGLTPIIGNDPAHKEMLDMGCSMRFLEDANLKFAIYEDTPFPPQEEFQWIRLAFEKQYNLMHAVSLKLLEYMAIGLGKDRFFFHPWFSHDSLSTQRAIHNMPRSANLVDSSALNTEQVKLTTPEHCDTGFITILTTFGYPGLQVEYNGEFKSVRPIYNQLIVNLGDIFNRITNF